MRSSVLCSRFLCLLLSLLILLNTSLTVIADSPTSVYIKECKLTAKGYFTYMYSDSGYTPTNSLDGQTLTLYFTAEAEHKILWDSDSYNYITNASSETVTGYLTQYPFKIETGQYVAVYQPHKYGSNNYTRDAYAYYKVTVSEDDIKTDLLYRSERSNTFIILISAGIVIIIISTLIKFIRRDL